MRIIAVARVNKVRPSEVMAIDDDYVAFCFDEACAFIADKYNEFTKKKKTIYWVEQYEPTVQKPINNAELFEALGG